MDKSSKETLKKSRRGEIWDLSVIDTVGCRPCVTAPRNNTQRVPDDSYASRCYRNHFDILHTSIGGRRKCSNHIRFATPSTWPHIISSL